MHSTLVTWAAAAVACLPMDALASKTPPTRPDPQLLRTLAETNNFSLGRPSHVRFTPDGKAILFLRSGGPRDRSASIHELDITTGKERQLVSAEQILAGAAETLTAEDKAARERKRISTGGFTGFELSLAGDRVVVKLSGKVYLIERPSGRAYDVPLPPGVILDPRLSPGGDKLAFVSDHNLYVIELPERLFEPDGKPARPRRDALVALTSGGDELVSHGLAEFVAQEEMGRFAGYWWSPDGTRIAYQTSDHRKVEHFTLADASRPEAPPFTFAYPRAGATNVEVTLHVVTTDGRLRSEVQWDRAAFPYVARVLWQRNAPLSVVVESRCQRELAFLAVDPQTGKTTLLHAEHDDAWLNLSSSTPRWFADGLSYLWATERSGGWALERHWPSGHAAQGAGAQRTSVPGKGEQAAREEVLDRSAGFAQLVHVDEGRRVLWFLGGQDPSELHLFRAPLDGRAPPERVSPAGGEHDATFAQDGAAYVLTRSSLEGMAQAVLHRLPASGAEAPPTPIRLPSVALEPEQAPNVEIVPPEQAGGFYAAITRPRDFDARRQYPVVLHVYGGPGFSMVHRSMTNYFLPQWIADHGFCVVSLDGRGTPRRGREFERALLGRFGSVPLDDQVTGLKALGVSRPFLDLRRVGVYGWSFGGYLAALAALRRPDVFKAAVAGAPVTDWTYYDTHYTERYLGLPAESPEAYKAGSLLTYAGQLERPLLLVHGIADDNVSFAHSLKLADALFRAGRPFQLLPLVGLTHQVADPAVREALYARIVEFLGAALW